MNIVSRPCKSFYFPCFADSSTDALLDLFGVELTEEELRQSGSQSTGKRKKQDLQCILHIIHVHISMDFAHLQ